MNLAFLVIHLAMSMSMADVKPSNHDRLFLSDAGYLFLSTRQGWGQLGLDQAAHAAGVAPQTLKIRDQSFQKGLGHHAPGEILVAVDGQYSRFEAEVGVQQQEGDAGTVVFKVFVDDRLAFDSGVMRQADEAKRVSVAVDGAEELRLVVEDGGDGITCDMANWANAMLVRDGSTSRRPFVLLDAAQFGEVVTCDPSRADGARAGRTEEYRKEDVYLERPVRLNNDGEYRVPTYADGRGCLGVRWLAARRLRVLSVVLAEGAAQPVAQGLNAEYWVGPTLWQGRWQPLPGRSEWTGRSWRHDIDWKDGETANGTRKIRLIFPASSDAFIVERVSALTHSSLKEVKLLASVESAPRDAAVEVSMHNGMMLNAGQDAAALSCRWETRDPLEIEVLYTGTRRWKPDRTIIHFSLPEGPASVAVEDVLTNGCAYVPHVGLFVTLKEKEITLEEYKEQIASRETVLDQTRRLPDQTFEQAIAKVHRAKQDTGPMLISLACDNHKFVAQRDGGILKVALPNTDYSTMVGMKTTGRVLPAFGRGVNPQATRRLESGWLPIPVTTVEEGDIVYQQRTFVAPFGSTALSLCVAEYTIRNKGSVRESAELSLRFQGSEKEDDRAEITGAVAHHNGKVLAYVKTVEPTVLVMTSEPGRLTFGTSLAAGSSTSLVCYMPHWDMTPEECGVFENLSSDQMLNSARAYWEKTTSTAMEIELPDPLLVNVIRASQVHCLLAARDEADGERVAPWISSDRYGPLESESNSIIRGMDFFGYHDFCRRSLDFFIHRYNKAGYLTTGYTMMGTGWHLWMLGEHYGLTKDAAWLRKHADEVKHVCNWVVAQRNKTLEGCEDPDECPERGLMPPGVMADWNNYAYYFCLNGYFYAGLKSAGGALSDIDYPDAKILLTRAEPFRRDIQRAYAWTQARMPVLGLRDGTYVKGYPTQVHCPGPIGDFFPGQDGNRSWCYDVELGAHHLVPLGVLDPARTDVASMMEHMEDVHFLSDGWFDYPGSESQKDPYNLGGFSKVQPYYSRNVEVYAMRDDVKPFIRSYFNTIPSLLNTEILSFWEHFNGTGGWNKTHETGYFLHQTRLMLVQERGDELWLAPFVTFNWLKHGMKVGVKNAPTRFGPVSYRIDSAVQDGHIDAQIDPPTRDPYAQIVVRFRHPAGGAIRRVTVNNAEHTGFDSDTGVIRMKPGAEKLKLRAYY